MILYTAIGPSREYVYAKSRLEGKSSQRAHLPLLAARIEPQMLRLVALEVQVVLTVLHSEMFMMYLCRKDSERCRHPRSALSVTRNYYAFSKLPPTDTFESNNSQSSSVVGLPRRSSIASTSKPEATSPYLRHARRYRELPKPPHTRWTLHAPLHPRASITRNVFDGVFVPCRPFTACLHLMSPAPVNLMIQQAMFYSVHREVVPGLTTEEDCRQRQVSAAVAATRSP